ncbi:MAG TPA: hypothetical protein VFL91_00585 [Thermomicrobiales bacterium]|nr:hypothetical protein [Thermomicrobiales bacterium]
MYSYYPTRQPVLVRDSELRVERRLPAAGEVKVRVGDRVEPGTVVAVAERPGRPVLLNVARELEVAPQDAGRRLIKAPGSTVAPDEPVARRRRGLRVRTVKSPCEGTVTGFDAATGILTLTPTAQRIELNAYAAGIVEDVELQYGVTIRLFGSRFYGAIGLGGEAHGVLKVLTGDRQQPLTAEAIDSRAARAVIAAGGGVNAAALAKAAQVGVKGVIVGSIEERELLAFLKVERQAAWRVGLPDWQLPTATAPFTIVVTEGFGQGPMAEPLYETLRAGDGEQVSLRGTTRLAGGLERPEVLLSGGSGRGAEDQGLPVAALVPGATVRLVDQDHLGALATVREAPRRRRLTGDLVVPALEVELATGGRVLVPTANVEVLA